MYDVRNNILNYLFRYKKTNTFKFKYKKNHFNCIIN